MKALIVEDNLEAQTLLEFQIRAFGYDVTSCIDAENALVVYRQAFYQLIILDLGLPGMDGFEFCRRVRALPGRDRSMILVITAYDTTEDLQAALEAGADDYLVKPVSFDLLKMRIKIIEQQLRKRIQRKQTTGLKGDNEQLQQEISEHKRLEQALRASKEQYRSLVENAAEAELRSNYRFAAIVGHHPKMVEILKLVAQIADTDATVLIQGESGTGKELIARALHDNSRRRNNPFVPINCAAIPEHLLESELFGHVRGAFTGAIKDAPGWFGHADGGTIFLDEVNDMSPALQVRLLRILQTGEYSQVGSTAIHYCDVRVIAATSQDLRKLVRERKFREEVYYRLNIIDIWLPPLRDRKCDIPLLAQHFLKLYGTKYGKQHVHLSEEAEALLLAYDFPGHIRELENMMQRAVIFAEDDVIAPCHLPADVLRRNNVSKSKTQYSTFKAAKEQAVEEFEREYIIDCLRASKGNISRAAKSAGIHVTNLHAKMKKYSISPHSFKT